MSAAFHETLKAEGVRHMVTVAHGQTLNLVSRLSQDPEYKVIYACREGEAVAIAAGLVLGGEEAVVSMECTGMFEACDTIRGLVEVMQIPMVFFIGYFGERTPGWQQKYEALGGMLDTVEVASAWTEPFLKAMDMPYYSVGGSSGVESLRKALQAARERSRPAAVLIEWLEG